jgi:NAD(P)-dependent dehydrogenase (short-subunit alcohol dehydrogenase family)
VTGGARRLGRALATTLAAEGVNTIIHFGNSGDEAEALRKALAATGVRAWTIAADLADPAQATTLIERAREAAGPIDILVNNASVFPADTLAELTLERLVATTRVNAWAPFALARAFARQTERGDVLQMLDAKLAANDPRHASYVLSKRLLSELTRMLAIELAPQIRVNAIAPGPVLPPVGGTEGDLERVAAAVPLRRPGKPDDIAEAALFLLRCDYVTGQVIYVDGGAHLASPPHG